MESVCSLVNTHLQGLGGETLGESRPPWEGLRKIKCPSKRYTFGCLTIMKIVNELQSTIT